jgi:hypothetical protein
MGALAVIDNPIEQVWRFAEGKPSQFGDQREMMVPDIIEFVCSDKYLDRPSLYPRQATLLKTIFLQDELYTGYDWDVLGEWVEGFRYPTRELTEDVTTIHYEGQWGINPDILERMKWLKEHNYRWFQVVCAVQGRRSGKGHIGAICGAYVLWHYLCTGDPQEHYGLAPGKRLASQVFAGKKAQARDNQWRDLVNSILSSNCFPEWINNPLGESITIYSPADAERIASQVESTLDQATFEIVPKEATLTSGRGPASFMQFYDEMAHMIATGASRSAEEVWNQAQPSLDQFKEDAFIYCGSSPWTMLGKFYSLVRESLEVDARTLKPINPTIMTIQLASWDIYKDWERTKGGDMVMSPEHRRPLPFADHNDGMDVLGNVIPMRTFPPLKVAIQEYDEKMVREERANPETFAVERRAHWATAQDSYFDPAHVDRTFRAWGGKVLEQTWIGLPGVHDYIAHGDPGKTSSNFGFAVAHVVPDPDGHAIPHVVFDLVHAWTPGDFPVPHDDGEIHYEMDYETVGNDMKRAFDGFLFTDLSFDQWNSINFVQSLGRYGQLISYKPTRVWERSTTAQLNWATAETMKVAMSLDRVHMPYLELAEMELKFLRKLPGDKVDHPSSGPVTTKDVYDAISIVVHKAIGGQIASAYGAQFTALQVGVALPGLSSASDGSTRGGTSRPLSEPAVQSMFSRDRDRRTSGRPIPGDIGGRRRPERR